MRLIMAVQTETRHIMSDDSEYWLNMYVRPRLNPAIEGEGVTYICLLLGASGRLVETISNKSSKDAEAHAWALIRQRD